MNVYNIISETIFLNEGSSLGPNQTKLSADPEKRKREKRFLMRVMVIGTALGVAVSAAQLLYNPDLRAKLIAAFKTKKIKPISSAIGKHLMIPIAGGIAGDLAVDPISVTAAQKLQDRDDRKKKK